MQGLGFLSNGDRKVIFNKYKLYQKEIESNFDFH